MEKCPRRLMGECGMTACDGSEAKMKKCSEGVIYTREPKPANVSVQQTAIPVEQVLSARA